MRKISGTLSTWQKFSYGLGNLGNCFIYVVVTSYILIYCTNVIGVAAGVVGTLMMIARVFDGITDVFMGRIIDVTKSRLGKARFWYVISIPPLGICMYLIFNVPATFQSSGKYVWIFIVYLLISAVFYTMNTIAYNTLVALTTYDEGDRVTMSSVSMLCGMGGAVAVSGFTPALVNALGGGQQGYQMMSLIYAAVGCIILLIPFFTLKELPEKSTGEEVKQANQSTVSFKDTIADLIRNKYFIIILLMYLFGYIATGINSTIGVYYATYILGDAALLGMLGFVGMVAMVIGIPFMPKLMQKAGMRRVTIIGAIVGTIGCVIAVIGNSAGFAVLMLGLFIKGLGQVPGSAAYSPLMAKTAEYNYLKTGHQITGSIFSCASVGSKIGTGLGTAMCGWMLEAAHFNGSSAIQSALAENVIFLLYLVIPTITTAISILLYSGMDIDEKITELKIRRAEGANNC